jgi:acetyl-CoA carboxylase biotin carboxyl carrier protein
MASQPPNTGDVFDVRKIRRLVELMNEHDLSEIDLRDADVRIRLRKGHDTVITSMAAPPSSPAPMAPAAPPAAAPAEKAADEKDVVLIKSIMVGTFFTSPSPDAPPFVKVGDHIGPDTTVCIIEAMKVFNEIPAGISGQIKAVLAQNGDPVEYGQPLFKVGTRG